MVENQITLKRIRNKVSVRDKEYAVSKMKGIEKN